MSSVEGWFHFANGELMQFPGMLNDMLPSNVSNAAQLSFSTSSTAPHPIHVFLLQPHHLHPHPITNRHELNTNPENDRRIEQMEPEDIDKTCFKWLVGLKSREDCLHVHYLLLTAIRTLGETIQIKRGGHL